MEYEGLHLICFECGYYGHKSESCPSLMHSTNINIEIETHSAGVATSGPTEGSVGGGVETPKLNYGPWMLPSYHRKKIGKIALEGAEDR